MSLLTHIFQGWLVLNAVAFAWLVGRGIGYGGHRLDWDCDCPECRDMREETL